MSIKSQISLIDLSRQLPFEIDDKLKKDICFGENLVISCGHYEGKVDDESSESEWTCEDSTPTTPSKEVEQQRHCVVQEFVEQNSKVEDKEENEEEENDFQFFFFPDCKKMAPERHSQSSIITVDGLPKINPTKTAHIFCTCKKDKKGECECFIKLPCLCGAKLKADCTCRELKEICTCDPTQPAPKCICEKAAVCTCDPDGKIVPVCVCDDVEKPCFCNIPNVFPSPVCKCKCKPKKVLDVATDSEYTIHGSEGQNVDYEYNLEVEDDIKEEPCDCQKPDPKQLCDCRKGKDCICLIECTCGVQKSCTCEPTDNENIPCNESENKSICNCDLPKDCVCGSQSDIVCECFPQKICTCGDPEHCKCYAVCTCKTPCICDLMTIEEKVCTCFDIPTGLSDIVCTCPKPENKNLKRVRAGKHGYRWCREVDPYHTYFDYAYGRHKKIEVKESEPEKLVIQDHHDKNDQEECPVHGEVEPKYRKKINKPFLDCCSAVGGISISVETLGEDKDKFLVQVVSYSSKEGAKTGSKLVSIVDCNLHTLEENRTEHITKRNLTKEKRSYMALCENGYYNKVTRICGDKHVVRRIYHSFEKAHDFLLEGANIVIMRYFALNHFKGNIKTETVMMDGAICQSIYVCHGISPAIVNGTPMHVAKVERHLIEASGFIHQTLTVLSLRGYTISHEWSDSCYVIHINPLLRIISEKDEIEQHAPLRENWRNDMQLLSDYLDFKSVRTSEGGRYITESGALTNVVRDYLQAILLLRPQDTLNFTRHYFGSVLSALDLPHDDYFDAASKHVRYYYFEE